MQTKIDQCLIAIDEQISKLTEAYRNPQLIHSEIQPQLRRIHEELRGEANNEIMRARAMADACWKSNFYRLDHAIKCSNEGVFGMYAIDRYYKNPFFQTREGFDFLVALAAAYVADGGDIFPAVDCWYHAQKIADTYHFEVKVNFADFVFTHKERIMASLRAEESRSIEQSQPIYSVPYGLVNIEAMLLSVFPAGSEEHDYLSHKTRPLTPPGEFERWEPENLPKPTSSNRAQFFYWQQQRGAAAPAVAATPGYGS
ncbi:hypothetical protein BN59_01142 [Legionella massiliensis]|uniref:Uncharacterized protein n=1 Tax=Legionella massiliensis TaxID=1034943 RepID=A0A078KV08_9GAMM|nr:hypothetical protein [Legionella massiliensis]CDZ76866.1 hypothetical protein BN59_01142 [Legionella massiliensis]CEE12604.1 hypothetical protein BN1094_01142 [Legionella massiliensis]